jgi:hypothetical protein
VPSPVDLHEYLIIARSTPWVVTLISPPRGLLHRIPIKGGEGIDRFASEIECCGQVGFGRAPLSQQGVLIAFFTVNTPSHRTDELLCC